MKKKLIALGLALALVGVSVVSGTLAYLTDTDQATNVFTVGNIDIELEETVGVWETKADYDAYVASGKTDVSKRLNSKFFEEEFTTSFTNIMPGNYIEKQVVITNTDSKNDAYVRVLVVLNNWEKISNVLIEGKTETEQNVALAELFDGWNMISGYENGVPGTYDAIIDHSAVNEILSVENKKYNENEFGFIYEINLSAGKSVKIFDGLYAPVTLDNDTINMFEGLTIEIYADAIQSEGFETADMAFDALEIAHPLDELRVAYPKAIVEKLDPEKTEAQFGGILGDDGFINTTAGTEDVIPFAVKFAANEENEYEGTWNADFVLSFDKDVKNDGLLKTYLTESGKSGIDLLTKTLLGETVDPRYFNDKIVLCGGHSVGTFPLPVAGTVNVDSNGDFSFEGNIDANREYRVMTEVFPWKGGEPLTYDEVLAFCSETGFTCGIIVLDEEKLPENLTANLELRVYETQLNAEGNYEETGTYYTVSKFSHTYNK